MFNKNKFLAIIKEKGKTVSDVAKVMGISVPTLYRKINGESDFYRKEIQVFNQYLDISDSSSIFFS